MSATFLAKLNKVLEAIGTNGTAAPDVTVPADIRKSNSETTRYVEDHKLLHEFYLVDFVAANINKRREKLKDRLKERFDNVLNSSPGDTKSISFGSYSLQKQVKNPAIGFDKDMLQSQLRNKYKWKQEDIEALMMACEKLNKPATTWTVAASSS